MGGVTVFYGSEESGKRAERVEQDQQFENGLAERIKRFKAGLTHAQKLEFQKLMDGMVPYYEIGRQSPAAMSNDEFDANLDNERKLHVGAKRPRPTISYR